MTEQTTGQTPPAAQTTTNTTASTGGATPTGQPIFGNVTVTPAVTPPAPGEKGKQPPWGDPENFNPEKAWELIQNLRNEKGDPAVSAQLEQMRAEQEKQRDAIAAALGIKPEEVTDNDKLAQQVEAMQRQLLDSQKRAIAIEHKVPETLLTATDAEGLAAQAAALAEFAHAAHYAAVTATPQTPPPAFQANPGQGQNGGAPSKEQLDQAEYEKYYPSKK